MQTVAQVAQGAASKAELAADAKSQAPASNVDGDLQENVQCAAAASAIPLQGLGNTGTFNNTLTRENLRTHTQNTSSLSAASQRQTSPPPAQEPFAEQRLREANRTAVSTLTGSVTAG